jgi:oxygen-independent coproporphyrinogen III oxidase
MRDAATGGALRHLYVHVPFCDGKCHYCGFYSEKYVGGRPLEPRCPSPRACIDALAREFDGYRPAGRRPAPETIYFGGGTPSVLRAPDLARLCLAVRSRTSPRRLAEWTVECNPATLTPEKAGILADAGVNRISIGAQSFDDRVLRRIGRRHSAADAAATVRLARSAGFGNIGLDLIAGLPGVSPRSWQSTLERALALEPAHLSVYALSIEPGAHWAAVAEKGELKIPSERVQLHALDAAERLLSREGYERYEVSNFARPGFACAHNLACWRGEDYLGLGPAAASRAGRLRWTNRADVHDYVAAVELGRTAPREADAALPSAVDVAERLMFGFRLKEGVDLTAFCRRWGRPAARLADGWTQTLRELARQRLAVRRAGRWVLTRRGRLAADRVAGEFLP